MLFIETFDQARAFGEAALRAMGSNRIAPNPRNYVIWYSHQTGRYPDLSRTLDIMIQNEADFSDECNDELYAKFFGTEQEEDELGKASEEMTTVLEQVLDTLSQAGENASSYGEHLRNFTGDIAHVDSKEDLKSLINGVLLETRRMQKRNRALEEKLKESSEQIGSLSERLEDVKREAMTDALTGIANRKCFDLRLREGTRDALESGDPLCLVMVDIDHFKHFNDTYGHQMGDQVLKLIGATLSQSVKGRDTPARYGGEEFAIILPKTRLEDAVVLAEQIRNAVANKRVTKKSTGEELCQITLSMGVALFRSSESLSDLVVRADEALYAAKRGGRNQVISEDVFDSLSVVG